MTKPTPRMRLARQHQKFNAKNGLAGSVLLGVRDKGENLEFHVLHATAPGQDERLGKFLDGVAGEISEKIHFAQRQVQKAEKGQGLAARARKIITP